MRFRKLRIAWSVFWGLACVLLIVLWVRSYQVYDSIGISRRCELASERGELSMGITALNSGFRAWPGQFKTYQVGSTRPVWSLHKTWSLFVIYGSELPRGVSYIVVKLPILVSAFGVLAYAPWLRWTKRFSLRTLLIATTLVAMVLGLVAWSMR
jgi:hypothetical protein